MRVTKRRFQNEWIYTLDEDGRKTEVTMVYLNHQIDMKVEDLARLVGTREACAECVIEEVL